MVTYGRTYVVLRMQIRRYFDTAVIHICRIGLVIFDQLLTKSTSSLRVRVGVRQRAYGRHRGQLYLPKDCVYDLHLVC